MKFLLPILLLILVACNSSTSPDNAEPSFSSSGYVASDFMSQKPVVDSVFMDAIDEFKHTADSLDVRTRKNMRKIKYILHEDLPGSISGMCDPVNHIIIIDDSITDPFAIKIVLFHELGHCVLGLAHIPEIDGIAIMNPVLHTYSEEWLDFYKENWETMKNNMFYGPKNQTIKIKHKSTHECCDEPCMFD